LLELDDGATDNDIIYSIVSLLIIAAVSLSTVGIGDGDNARFFSSDTATGAAVPMGLPIPRFDSAANKALCFDDVDCNNNSRDGAFIGPLPNERKRLPIAL
jgi:hypothetical protein